MRTAKIPLLVVVYLFSNVGFGGIFGNIFGKKKDDSKVNQVEEKVVEEDFNAPSVEILGNSYPVNKIDLPAETIYKNHTREQLIALLGEVLNLSTLEREEDTLEDSYRKYFASVIGTAHLLEGYSSALITSSSRILQGQNEKKVSLVYLFDESEARRIVELAKDVLYPTVPRDFSKLGRGYYSAMGYRLFVKEYAASIKKHTDENSLQIEDVYSLLDDTDRFLIAKLIKDTYYYWNEINNEILSRMPSSLNSDYKIKWKDAHSIYFDNEEITRNLFLSPFRREIFKFAKFSDNH